MSMRRRSGWGVRLQLVLGLGPLLCSAMLLGCSEATLVGGPEEEEQEIVSRSRPVMVTQTPPSEETETGDDSDESDSDDDENGDADENEAPTEPLVLPSWRDGQVAPPAAQCDPVPHAAPRGLSDVPSEEIIVRHSERASCRLFFLSGQSNMHRVDMGGSFVPMIEAAFPQDCLLFVKVAYSSKEIRYWVTKQGDAFVMEPYLQRMISAGKDAMETGRRRGAGEAPRRLRSVAIMWMQGESNARSGDAGDVYFDSLAFLASTLRTTFGEGQQDEPAFQLVIGRLSDNVPTSVRRSPDGEPVTTLPQAVRAWNLMRRRQVLFAGASSDFSWVDADALNGPRDGLHFGAPGSAGYQAFGECLAKASIAALR